MVIHEESECPVEVSVIRKPAVLEPKKYLVISNHVRELSTCTEEQQNENFTKDESVERTESLKRSKKSKRKRDASSEESEAPQISGSDLEELRTVYHNCLAVINKIENKYGHLLGIDKPTGSTVYTNEESHTCNCARKKKIVFNDDGTQKTIDVRNDDHICATIPQKLKRSTDKCNVERDEEDYSYSLSDDLPTLAKMLHDPNLNLNYRNKIIKKINDIKNECSNELRFNKPALIQSIRQNPNEVLGFRGVNWISIPGYF